LYSFRTGSVRLFFSADAPEHLAQLAQIAQLPTQGDGCTDCMQLQKDAKNLYA